MAESKGEEIEVHKDNTIETKEKIEIPRFSEEARKFLEEKGFEIFELKGKTLEEMYLEGAKFYFAAAYYLNGNVKKEGYVPDRVESLRTEVAINPSDLYRFEGGKPLLLPEDKELLSEIQDFSVIIGRVSDYAELAFDYYKKTGQVLFCKRENESGVFTRIVNARRALGNKPPLEAKEIVWFPKIKTADRWHVPNDEDENFWQLRDGTIVYAGEGIKHSTKDECHLIVPK